MKPKQDFEVLLNFHTKSNEVHNNQSGNSKILKERKDAFILSEKGSFSLPYRERGVRGSDRDSD